MDLRFGTLFVFAALFLSPLCTNAQDRMLNGQVFADDNGNSKRDPGEQGVAGVAVSNGVDVVMTPPSGGYALRVAPGQIVFIIKPAGFEVPVRANGLPAFWFAYQPSEGPRLRYGGLRRQIPQTFDFALRPAAARPAKSRMLIFADPQAKQLKDVGYYKEDIVSDVRSVLGTDGSAFSLGISLGDIVNDDLSLYPAMNAVTASLGVPWLHLPGNHDVDMDASSDTHALDTYRHTFGPDTFAWNAPDFTFIGLDDVLWQGAPSSAYTGGFREDQLHFLRNYLPTLPSERMLVVGLHIPLFEPDGRDTFRDDDRKALFGLLARFQNVLVLSAHNHTQQHFFHGVQQGWTGARPLHEYNVGAACGAFWSGVKDARGIPVSTMADGTPNGWATLESDRTGHYTLDWQAARDRTRPAMHLSAPKVLRRGAYPAWGLYANAYMVAPDALVEYKVDDGAWKPMQRVRRPDPVLLAENLKDDASSVLRGYDRSPEAQNVEHLWRGALPTDLETGPHEVTVRFNDINGRSQTGSRKYNLLEATP